MSADLLTTCYYSGAPYSTYNGEDEELLGRAEYQARGEANMAELEAAQAQALLVLDQWDRLDEQSVGRCRVTKSMKTEVICDEPLSKFAFIFNVRRPSLLWSKFGVNLHPMTWRAFSDKALG